MTISFFYGKIKVQNKSRADSPKEKIMEKRYYAGLALEKDFEMCKLYDELERDNRFEIIDSGRKVEVVEMRYKNNYDTEREATGKTHIGFDFYYINVKYKEFVLNIEPASNYPFTDKNDPARINAVPFVIIGENKRIQSGYRFPAMSANEIVEYVEKNREFIKHPLKGVFARPIKW